MTDATKPTTVDEVNELYELLDVDTRQAYRELMKAQARMFNARANLAEVETELAKLRLRERTQYARTGLMEEV